jgi:hypothetical protein
VIYPYDTSVSEEYSYIKIKCENIVEGGARLPLNTVLVLLPLAKVYIIFCVLRISLLNAVKP